MKFKIGDARNNKIINFDNIIDNLIDDIKITDEIILNKVKDNWKKIVGNILFTHSFPDRIFKSTLFISVDHSIFANELSYYSKIMLKKINDFYNIKKIKKIKFQIKKSRWEK